ncbi:DUF4114 domain-containing protein [Desulfococcaceae bacterium HSG8]|nr:DUF4114 domain-containing protein [Desulfococcaceae bacterium HSG8]
MKAKSGIVFLYVFAVLALMSLSFSEASFAGTIEGFKFNDVNGNGVMDSGEPPSVNHNVFIKDNTSGSFRSAITDTNGHYSFTNLSISTFTIWSGIPNGWRQTTPVAGVGLATYPAVLGQQNQVLTINFGITEGEPVEFKDPCDDFKEDELDAQSIDSGEWNDPATWKDGKIPTAGNVVWINSGHTVSSLAPIELGNGGLCIKGSLESADNTIGSSPRKLEIRAGSIHNSGTIKGKNGAPGRGEQDQCSNYSNATGGSSIEIWVDILINDMAAQIMAGNGGDDLTYEYLTDWPGGCWGNVTQGGVGGNIEIFSNTTINDFGIIQAGDGGRAEGEGVRADGRKYYVHGPTYGGDGGFVVVVTNTENDPDNSSNNGGAFVGGQGGHADIPRAFKDGDVAWQTNDGFSKSGKGGDLTIFMTDQSGRFEGSEGSITRWDPIRLEASSTTRFEGSDKVIIYSGEDGNIDLTKLSERAVSASKTITIAVGSGGKVDLRGINKKVFEAGERIEIFSDVILLDFGISFEDIADAPEIVVGPSKTLYHVKLSAEQHIVGERGTTLSIDLKMLNASPANDTYTLNVSDSAGWNLGTLPDTVALDVFETKQLTLDVDLPATPGETNTITVTVASQADPNVMEKLKVKVSIQLSEDDRKDLDNDGLLNFEEEYRYNTDPENPDTDGDTMPDGWEVNHGLNPIVDDASADLDNDGLLNIAEYNGGTDPIANATYLISGHIRASDGAVIEGVVLAGLPGNPITNSDGFYSVLVNRNWLPGTVRPQKDGYIFEPAIRTYPEVPTDQIDQDYAGIEGRVDVWVADPAPDTGEEPNTVSRAIWCSPSVWVRNQDDGVYQYQNVKSGQDNYVYVKAQNRGTLTATNTTVEVYRTNSTLGIGWDKGWELVGTSNIGSLAPNGTETAVIRWDKDEIPKPGHYCFYVRLVNADDPMTFPEIGNPVRNTYNNNNVAWRNFSVVGLLTKVQEQFEVIVRNIEESPADIGILFEEEEQLLKNNGAGLIVDLGLLFQRWKDAGANGENVLIFGETKVKILETPASITGIEMDAGEEQTIVIKAEAYEPMPGQGTSREYRLSVQETIGGQVIGGVDYTLVTRAQDTDTDGDEIPDIDDEDDDGDEIPDSWEKDHELNPLNEADASEDPDGNGKTHLEEYLESMGRVDVWIADGPRLDTGEEPNPNRRVYGSRSIWVRNQQDNGTRHQNPIYGQVNYVYVKVQNRGTLTAEKTVVRLYRTNASLGNGWPGRWEEIDGENFNDHDILNLAPNETRIIAIPWDDVPKPGHYCFLVRLECEQDSMTFSEETGRAIINAYNNNNIAWRNFNVISLLTKVKEEVEMEAVNIEDHDATIDLVFEEEEHLLDNGGVVIVDLGALFQRWQDAEGHGENIEVLSGTEVRILTTPARITGILMAAGEVQVIRMRAEAYEPMPEEGTSREYHFKVMEYLDAELVGGVDFIIIARALDTDTDEDGIPDADDEDDDNDSIPDGEDDDPLNVEDASEQDPDEDGLSNSEEAEHGTDPMNPDTDDDGVPDGWEVDLGLDPLVNDILEDLDNDGYSNIEEIKSGTDPTDPASHPDGPFGFTAGVFTVGASGIVEFDWLYDGGAYKGEVAIFSLEGMDALIPNSPAFIWEAARRALSNSEDGYIALSDLTEAARFDDQIGGESYNSGTKIGIRHFTMTAGDRFAVMLVPGSTVQAVFDDPTTTNSRKRPLFSLASSNPEHGMYLGQIADINGLGSAFCYEDLVFTHSDRDYNDIIFQILGARGDAPKLDSLIAPGNDWTKTEEGEKIINYVSPLVIADASGVCGGSMNATVRIHETPHPVDALGFELVFDSDVLSYTDFTTEGTLAEDFSWFECHSPSDGVIRCGGFTNTGEIAERASGDLVHLEFDISECDKTKLELRELKDDISEWPESFRHFAPAPCDGDINGDGEITPGDALCAFEKYMNTCPTSCGLSCDEICGDVNGDGKTTPADALCIFNNYLGNPNCLE